MTITATFSKRWQFNPVVSLPSLSLKSSEDSQVIFLWPNHTVFSRTLQQWFRDNVCESQERSVFRTKPPSYRCVCLGCSPSAYCYIITLQISQTTKLWSIFQFVLPIFLMYKKLLPHRLENWGKWSYMPISRSDLVSLEFTTKTIFFRYIFSFGENRTLLRNNACYFLVERFPAVNNWLAITLFNLFTITIRTIRIPRWKHSLNLPKAAHCWTTKYVSSKNNTFLKLGRKTDW